jgi:Uma2 family endonuclease
MSTTAAATPDDVLRLPGYELIDGELKEMPVSLMSSYLAGRVYRAIDRYAEAHGGWVFPEGTSFRCFPFDDARVRRADTAYFAADRMTAALATTEGHCTVVPDLVVEVVSPHDTAGDVYVKVEEWLAAGARLVWVVYPESRVVQAHAADGRAARFRTGDTLTADPVLAGFAVPVADLFRLPAAAP